MYNFAKPLLELLLPSGLRPCLAKQHWDQYAEFLLEIKLNFLLTKTRVRLNLKIKPLSLHIGQSL